MIFAETESAQICLRLVIERITRFVSDKVAGPEEGSYFFENLAGAGRLGTVISKVPKGSQLNQYFCFQQAPIRSNWHANPKLYWLAGVGAPGSAGSSTNCCKVRSQEERVG